MAHNRLTKQHIASDIMDKVNKAIDSCEKKYKVFIKYNVQIEKIEHDPNPKNNTARKAPKRKYNVRNRV